MPKKTKEKSQDLGKSPQKKRSRQIPLSSDEEEEEEFQFLPPTRISENDPLFGNQTSRQVPKTVTQEPSTAVTDEEWEEMLRMTKKEIPGINVPSPNSARKRRQNLKNQIQGRRNFKEGQYKISPSIKNHEIFDQITQGIYKEN